MKNLHSYPCDLRFPGADERVEDHLNIWVSVKFKLLEEEQEHVALLQKWRERFPKPVKGGDEENEKRPRFAIFSNNTFNRFSGLASE